MSLSVKIDPIDRDLKVMFNEMLGPQARSAMIAGFARQALVEAEEQDLEALGHVPDHTVFVDGAEGASEDSVRPDGTIVYEFAIVSDLFSWISDQLTKASPVLSGRFSQSFKLFADGTEVDPNNVPPNAAEYVFLNSQPYARKIERGFSPQAPNGVFEAVAALARVKFSRLAKVSFTYRSLLGGEIGAWAKTPSARRLAARHRRNPAKHTEWLTHTPAIVVTVK